MFNHEKVMFEENVSISFRNIRSLRESSQKESSCTLTPSSVKIMNNSAAARALRGQFLTNFRPDKMCFENESDGQKRLKGKRKLGNENDEENDYFSPKKIPKITQKRPLQTT